MKNLFIRTICLLCIGLMGCMEKNEGTITSEAEKLKFDKLFAKLKQNHPEATFALLDKNSTELRTSDCRPPAGGSDCIETTVSGYTVDVNGCPVTTGAKVKICTDPITLEVYLVQFWDFTWSFTSDADCWTFRLDMSDHYVNSRWTDLQNDMEAFYRLLTRNFEENYLASLVLDVPPCGSGYTNIGHFYEDECQLFCAQLGEYNENAFYDILFAKRGEACCRRITAYCLFNGEPIPFPQEIEPIGEPECDPVSVDCGPGNQVPNVDCNHPCDRL